MQKVFNLLMQQKMELFLDFVEAWADNEKYAAIASKIEINFPVVITNAIKIEELH